jgi:dTDP-4-amino-4,6-dideoxygalactose transaminase
MRSDPITFYGCRDEYRELEPRILSLTAGVLGTGHMLQSPEVERFEHRVAEMAGTEYAVAVGSGTDALFFSLLSLGIGAGDDVLVPAISFVASATSILRTGARPVFVDIDLDCQLDLGHAAALVTARTRALVLVDLFGGMGNPIPVEEFAAKYGLRIVEDFAQAFGASYAGRRSGSIGVVGATSFDPTKVIGAPGSGGALVTNDLSIAERVRSLRLHGKHGKRFVELGYNSQLPSWTAAVLSLKLECHAAWTARRAALAGLYMSAFEGLALTLPNWDGSVAHVWHKFVLFTEARDELRSYLATVGVPTMIHYATPLFAEPVFANTQDRSQFPGANRHARQALSLPIHSYLDNEEAHHIASAVKNFLS